MIATATLIEEQGKRAGVSKDVLNLFTEDVCTVFWDANEYLSSISINGY